MERRGHCHGKHPPPLPPPRRARGERSRQASSGSFSASLLDAIYRSLDEGGGDGADVVDAPRWSEAEKATATAPPQFWWAKEAAAKAPRKAASADGDGRRRRETAAVARPRHSGYASSTASSSDSSASYSGFSCSSASTTDTESTTRRHRSPPPPPRVPKESVAVGAAAEAAAKPNSKAKKKKSRPCFPGVRIRPRSPSQPTTGPPPPPSPATFACVLKALFSSARLQRKPKATPVATAPAPISPAPPQPSRVSAATTVKAADVSERRSVRFRDPDAEASVVQRRVEELVRTLEELEEDGEGSDSSSDLFELESLRGAGGDELPVYGTTSLAANRAIAQRAAS